MDQHDRLARVERRVFALAAEQVAASRTAQVILGAIQERGPAMSLGTGCFLLSARRVLGDWPSLTYFASISGTSLLPPILVS